jgi:hypothetical protein
MRSSKGRWTSLGTACFLSGSDVRRVNSGALGDWLLVLARFCPRGLLLAVRLRSRLMGEALRGDLFSNVTLLETFLSRSLDSGPELVRMEPVLVAVGLGVPVKVTSGLLESGRAIVDAALDRFRLNCSAMDGARGLVSEAHLSAWRWGVRGDF